MNRLHIQFCLHCHKEDLRLCGRDSPDHQKDCRGRKNRQHYRQGLFSILLSFRHLGAVTLSGCVSFRHVAKLVPPVHFQTILGDFQKEQQKFVKEKKSKKSGEFTSIFFKCISASLKYYFSRRCSSSLSFYLFIYSCTVCGENVVIFFALYLHHCHLELTLESRQDQIHTE